MPIIPSYDIPGGDIPVPQRNPTPSLDAFPGTYNAETARGVAKVGSSAEDLALRQWHINRMLNAWVTSISTEIPGTRRRWGR